MHTVKFAEGSDTIIEGLAIPFNGPDFLGGKDFHGERFTPDTDYVFDLYPHGRPFLYNHGVNKMAELTVQGRQYEHEMTDEGVFARVELDKAAKYHAVVARMIRDGKLGFSSGAIPHLVKTAADGTIQRWPWQELSGTPTPANPDGPIAFAVKSADHIDHLYAAGIEPTAALIKTLIGGDDSEHESFAGHAERVTALVDAFAGRSLSRFDARVKAGRALSAANRAEIEEVISALDGVMERRQALLDLLARTGPKDEERKAIEAAYIDYLHEQARQLGVPLS